MKSEELTNFLTSHGYYYERDSEYNRDVFTNPSIKVGDQMTKMEIFADYYTVRLVWWYGPHQKVGTSTYMKDLDEAGLQLLAQNLIANNIPQKLEFTAYTDGSCHNLHPERPGGAAYIIFDSEGKEIKRASKGFMKTSNNRMEVLAILSVVNYLPPNSHVTIHSDSQYSINVLSRRWQALENLDQITKYWKICKDKHLDVKFVWVKGHDGNKYNEECDQMARAEYAKKVKE